MLWCCPMWHIFPHEGHMEIESLRLDFLTLIIIKPQNNSRAYQRRKKKKKKQKNPGSALPRSRGRALPGPPVAQVAHGPGSMPRPSLPPRSSGFLFGCSEKHKVWTCVFSESLDSFSLRSDAVLDFLSFFFFFFFFFFCVFWVEWEAWAFNFFKFFWYKSSFRHSIST